MHYENHHFPEFLAGPPHPPYGPEVGPWYDRCAPGCDDQLAMFSRVGRGLKGNSYKVVIKQDSDLETYLEGLDYDEASGTWASDWVSENINGGRLDYQYNLRPYTIPQTFTMTFRYRRPGRDPYQWTWTTPAIPYIWDADDDGTGDVDGIVGVGAATLFLKKTQDAWVTTNLPTSYTIAEALGRQEKLLYPEGWTRDQLNAPGVGDPYTINLTYGIGGDFDAPNIDDLSKVLGITVQNIRNIIANSPMPTHTIPDENLKQYIDNMVDNVEVVSNNPDLLKVTKTTHNHNNSAANFDYGVDFLLDPLDLVAGPGIQITIDDGAATITNTQVGGNWQWLTPGTDYLWSWYNGWFGGADQDFLPHTTNPSTTMPPLLRIIPSYDLGGNLVGGEINVRRPDNGWVCNKSDILDTNNFAFAHDSAPGSVQASWICGITFIGDYADLNNANVLSVTAGSNNNIWNVQGTNDPIGSSSADWKACGASWIVNCNVQKDISGTNRSFLMYAMNISDGYNGQYATPVYGYSHLAIRPHANFNWNFTLG